MQKYRIDPIAAWSVVWRKSEGGLIIAIRKEGNIKCKKNTKDKYRMHKNRNGDTRNRIVMMFSVHEGEKRAFMDET